MIIGVDGTNIRAGGGITHLVHLLGAAKPHDHGIERIVVWGPRGTVELLPERPWLETVHVPKLDGSMVSRLGWQRFVLPGLAARTCDVLFVPGGNAGRAALPIVTMSRNMLPFEWPELRRYGLSPTALRLLLLRFGQALTFRNAEGLIFLTEYAREAVSERVRIPGRIAVIPHGVEEAFRHEPPVARSLADCSEARPLRALYVSIVNMYKHQWHVAEAFARVHSRNLPITLDMVGPSHKAALPRLQEALARLDPDGKFLHYRGPVPHRELPAVYHGCELFVFASSCENMPNILLEAMASGLPIACSNRGPMPEVLGDAGLYFDPERPGEIEQALEALVRNPALRADLARRARARALEYSWERCARETLAFIAEVGARAKRGAPVGA
jgi:glycosyltransferase involved in cell wall biosynthesis